MRNIDPTIQFGTAIAGHPLMPQHPITKTIDEIRAIMNSLSLIEEYGPHIDAEEYNFDHLNISSKHPARGMHDTFYVANEEAAQPSGDNLKNKYYPHMLLRSHTSNTQIHVLESGKYKTPFGVFTIGRCYRRDQDSTHLPMFHQIEVLMLDDDISISNLKWLIKRILMSFFTHWTPEFRFRSSYFPFTEPSIEVDMTDSTGEWREVLGSGMVRSNIMERYGYHTKGLAIGMGLERLCMLKYGITDISTLYSSKHDFLSTWA